MTLTNEQVIQLNRAMELLEAADSRLQKGFGNYVESSDFHYRIEEILADIEMLIEEAEMVDSLDV